MAFLQNATQVQRVRAVADNHRQSIILRTRESGGEVHRLDGVTWVYNPKEQRAFVLFPKLVRAQGYRAPTHRVSTIIGLNSIVNALLEGHPSFDVSGRAVEALGLSYSFIEERI